MQEKSQLTDQFNLSQIVQEATKIINHSKTRVDLLFMNKVRKKESAKHITFPTSISDHNMIFFTRKQTKLRLGKSLRPKICIFSIPKKQQQNLVEAVKRVYWSNITQCKDIETSCNIFLNKIQEVLNSFATRGTYRKRKGVLLPWIDNNCRSLKKQLTTDGLPTD